MDATGSDGTLGSTPQGPRAPTPRARRPAPRRIGRFTPQEAVLGLTALGLFFWGSVATLVGYRLDRTQRICCGGVTSPVPPGPRIRLLPPEQRNDLLWAQPAWAPYPTPRPLGLATGRPAAILVR